MPATRHRPDDSAAWRPDGPPAETLLRRVSGGLLRARLSLAVALLALLQLAGQSVSASTAYGSINNFDCVNDTGVEAHGFEIELDDVHSKDITYTYDYNHYGVPKITEDTTDPLHPKVFVRYAAVRNPNGTWSAYSAIPSGPIAPTMGHQFTNPSVNFGGEHFGVGYYGLPSALKYNWLIDDGTGSLVHGPPVYVATPTFVYYPPVPAAPIPQVQAVIVPPPPPAPPVFRFGKATFVKAIKTTSHNTNKVELVDLVSEDPANPGAKNWANGEPTQVETEWKLLQTEFANPANPKGELKGAAEDLPGGNEIVTRRYEFYKYVGPIDAESGEAMADAVAADGIHGVGSVTYIDSFDALGEPVVVTVDLSTIVVVSDFFGSQMSGFDVAPGLGLIDHLPDGDINQVYADRTVVIGGGAGFLATLTGALPDGLSFDTVTGILSGTPTTAGAFALKVEATGLDGTVVLKDYTLTIAGNGGPVAVTRTISASANPVAGGSTSGSGVYNDGAAVTVNAVANAGYTFANWTEGGAIVAASASYPFAATSDRILAANFVRITRTISTSASPLAGGITSGGGVYNDGAAVTLTAVANAGYAFVDWSLGGVSVAATPSYTFAATADASLVANFVRITRTIATSASPVAGGATSGDGVYNDGDPVTVSAVPNAGYAFVDWSLGGTSVASTPSYTFAATADASLVANFVRITWTITTSAAPVAGGTTSGGGVYNDGDPVTVVATANAGYTFANWTEGGAIASTAPSLSFPAGANRSLVANFTAIPTGGVTLQSLVVAPRIASGEDASGVVRLSAPAPKGGATVQLSSSDPKHLRVPATVFVPAGRTAASFPISSAEVRRDTIVEIRASWSNATKSAQVTLAPTMERD